MRHTKLLISPAEALLRVYAPTCQPTFQRRGLVRRPLANSQPAPSIKDFKKPSPSALDKKLAAFKLDDRIEASWVQVRQEDATLARPTRLETLLNDIAPTEVVLELSPQGQFPDTAVVRVVPRDQLLKEVADKESALKEIQKKSKQLKPKQLELNWAISGHDFEIKLAQMADFLDKGKKVEILLAPKRRQRRATPEEAQQVMDKLRDKIDEIGAKEVKTMEGALMGQATLTVQKTQSS